MLRFGKYAVSMLVAALFLMILGQTYDSNVSPIRTTAAQTTDCQSLPNPIARENCVGVPATDWDITGPSDPTVQAFATDISFNRGETVKFKINISDAGLSTVPIRLDIYRLGYYQGAGARKITTLTGVAGQQNDCRSDSATGLIDCGNWTEWSSTWASPSDADHTRP